VLLTAPVKRAMQYLSVRFVTYPLASVWHTRCVTVLSQRDTSLAAQLPILWTIKAISSLSLPPKPVMVMTEI